MEMEDAMAAAEVGDVMFVSWHHDLPTPTSGCIYIKKGKNTWQEVQGEGGRDVYYVEDDTVSDAFSGDIWVIM